MSEAEALCFDTLKVSILTGIDPTIWRIHIKDRVLEFKSSELLDDVTFRKKYISVFNKSIYFTKRQWNAFVNAISEKAEIVDVADYSGYYGHALYLVAYMLDYIVELDHIVDAQPENLFCMIDKKDGFYYLPVVTAKYLIKKFNYKIGKKTTRIVLEKLCVKTDGDVFITICGESVEVWQLSVEKIYELGVDGWD
jgi:hypothetical protein